MQLTDFECNNFQKKQSFLNLKCQNKIHYFNNDLRFIFLIQLITTLWHFKLD